MVSPVDGSAFVRSSPLDQKMPDKTEQLRNASEQLEANFIAEMLKAAKFGEPLEHFGGGIGEEQFSSFLRDEHARALAERGGFGLAEAIFESLVRYEDANRG